MSNPNGRKGASFERSIADYLAEHWDDRIDRRVKTGAKDKGDIANFRIVGPHKLVMECKNVKVTNLTGWVREAHTEAENDDATTGVVVHKRRGVGDPGQQFVTMTVNDLLTIIRTAKGESRDSDQ